MSIHFPGLLRGLSQIMQIVDPGQFMSRALPLTGLILAPGPGPLRDPSALLPHSLGLLGEHVASGHTANGPGITPCGASDMASALRNPQVRNWMNMMWVQPAPK